MALTRSMLNGMGLTAEQITAIIEGHTESIDGLKEQIAELKDKADKYTAAAKELDDLKKDSSGEEWKAKYEKEADAFKKYKADITAKEERTAKEDAYKALLKDAGVSEKVFTKICKVTDFDTLKITDGALDNAEDLKATIKTEWGDFIETKETEGAGTETPPANNGGDAKVNAIPTFF